MSSLELPQAAALLAPSISLMSAGAILSISLFAIPPIKSTSSQLSTTLALKQLRKLFQRGAIVFPSSSVSSAVLYAYLAYLNPQKATGFGVSGTFSMGIAAFTVWIMVPAVNGRLIELRERVEKDASEGKKYTAEVDGLFDKFNRYNNVRAGMMAVSGLVGMYTAFLA